MLSGHDKVWMHYVNDIIAAEISSAVFLSLFMKQTSLCRKQARFLEILDLQRYKVIRKEQKVRAALPDVLREPFIFVVGKN